MTPRILRLVCCGLIVAICAFQAPTAEARILLKNICRVKGQEENTLQGLGIVVGLNGTGDGGDYLPTIRSLATAMQLMGGKIGQSGPVELKNAKNVALVLVTATIPGQGARQGDRVDCVVSSIGGAKSLDGGRLFPMPLQGPQVGNFKVFAFAEGPIELDNVANNRTGRIHDGCKLEEDFFSPFVKNDKITLVLNKSHAHFQVAQDVAELLNSQLRIQNNNEVLAKVIDQVNIEVTIPEKYRDAPALFTAEVLSMPMLEPQNEARVVINERAGSIVISGDLEIGSAVVSHKNIVIEAGVTPAERFVGMELGENRSPTLKSLVQALNAVNAPPADVIEIIKGLDKTGKLYGKLEIE